MVKTYQYLSEHILPVRTVKCAVHIQLYLDSLQLPSLIQGDTVITGTVNYIQIDIIHSISYLHR